MIEPPTTLPSLEEGTSNNDLQPINLDLNTRCGDDPEQQQSIVITDESHRPVPTTINPTSSSSVPTTRETSPKPTLVPGTYSPKWLPDNEVDSCMSCATLFTMIKRRHHCRSCGRIFCNDCCKQKAKLLFMDNKEARVCSSCYATITELIEQSGPEQSNILNDLANQEQTSTISTARCDASQIGASSTMIRVIHGVLKTNNQPSPRSSGVTTNDLCNTLNNSSPEEHNANKQVIFSDGIRPGTDLLESSLCPILPSASSGTHANNDLYTIISRQNHKVIDSDTDIFSSNGRKNCNSGSSRTSSGPIKKVTVCDELGFLPPIVIGKDTPVASTSNDSNSSNPLTNLLNNHFKSSKKNIQASMESRNCPLNGVIKFEDLSNFVGIDNVVTFSLVRSLYLKVKIIKKDCCLNRKKRESRNDAYQSENEEDSVHQNEFADRSLSSEIEALDTPEYWCCTSSGLDKLGQDEIIFVLNKDKDNPCIPRDIFKIYLTLHELALRRQTIENLGNLLFQDGLFGSRDTAGLLFVQPTADHCLKNIVLPSKKFLIALVLQRWEVPWSKVFPIRLLLRLGHKYEIYPYPIVSCSSRDPVYYEIGHTIISILGDFRNFRYSLTHVEGLKVMLNKSLRKVTVHLQESSYLQFSKVLDNSNNEHVLAWSSCPFTEADGHLVSVQNDNGQYDTYEFYKKSFSDKVSFKNLETNSILGASFIVFSGALKADQSGQPAKVSIVEDGLLIQIQSCTMTALRNAIHYMDNFDIDCENTQDTYNIIEIRWQNKDALEY